MIVNVTTLAGSMGPRIGGKLTLSTRLLMTVQAPILDLHILSHLGQRNPWAGNVDTRKTAYSVVMAVNAWDSKHLRSWVLSDSQKHPNDITLF